MINILGSEDYLEDMHLEDMDEVSKEKTDSYTKIKGCLKEYASIVLPHLFKESAQLDAKYNKALSYPAHVITAVFAGSILYIYDRISTEQPLPNSHDIRLLCTALTLHDVNKYWRIQSNPACRICPHPQFLILGASESLEPPLPSIIAL